MLVCSNQVQKSTKVLRLFLRHRETALEKVYLTAFTALYLFCAFFISSFRKSFVGFCCELLYGSRYAKVSRVRPLNFQCPQTGPFQDDGNRLSSSPPPMGLSLFGVAAKGKVQSSRASKGLSNLGGGEAICDHQYPSPPKKENSPSPSKQTRRGPFH